MLMMCVTTRSIFFGKKNWIKIELSSCIGPMVLLPVLSCSVIYRIWLRSKHLDRSYLCLCLTIIIIIFIFPMQKKMALFGVFIFGMVGQQRENFGPLKKILTVDNWVVVVVFLTYLFRFWLLITLIFCLLLLLVL